MNPKFLISTIAIILLFVIGCEDAEEAIEDFEDQYITVSIDGGATRTYDKLPLMSFYVIEDSTYWIGAIDSDDSSTIVITFKGQAADTYDVSRMEGSLDNSSNFNVTYLKSEAAVYAISTSGDVTITGFGAVGEPVVGTYDAVTGAILIPPTAVTARLSGSFKVLRTIDVQTPPIEIE